MYRYQLSVGKADILRKRFIEGDYMAYVLAKTLKISPKTTWFYKKEFEKIRANYPDRLRDFGFYPGDPRRPHWATLKYDELMRMLPCLVAEQTKPTIQPGLVWASYAQRSEHTYKFPTFKPLLFKWIRENVTTVIPKLLDHIAPTDIPVLKQWRKSNNHRLWQIAKCLEMAKQGASRQEIIDEIESSYKTIAQWLAAFYTTIIAGFLKLTQKLY